MDFAERTVPKACEFVGPAKSHRLLSDAVHMSRVIMATDVAHAGIVLKSHISIANRKMTITRCWIIVNPGISKFAVGIHHKMIHTNNVRNNVIDFLKSPLCFSFSFSASAFVVGVSWNFCDIAFIYRLSLTWRRNNSPHFFSLKNGRKIAKKS